MKSIDVIIPSCQSKVELDMMVNVMRRCDDEEFQYIPTGFPASASVNRNYGLMRSTSDIIIMIDDDIGGFCPQWQRQLIEPLDLDPNIRIVTARLMTPEGGLSPMIGCDADMSIPYKKAVSHILSACIAFRREDIYDIWFDENFIGSGFEDTDFCFQLKHRFPECDFVVNNTCRMIHYHEMKNQKNDFFLHNKSYFEKKWEIKINV